MKIKHKSREDLLKENLRLMQGIEQLFTDADSWNKNVRKSGEEKINPDPRGEMARNWLKFYAVSVRLGAYFKPAMEAHFKKFSVPCNHEKISEDAMCESCMDFVYYVYCPKRKCGWAGIDAVDAPCPKCLTPLHPDQIEPE